MKKLLLSFVAIALAVISVRAQVEINSTNFPDDNFRAQVKEAFDNIEEDDIISDEEMEANEQAFLNRPKKDREKDPFVIKMRAMLKRSGF